MSAAIENLLLWAMLILPAMVILFRYRVFPKLHVAWLFALCCLFVYSLLLARVSLIELRFDAELDLFDLNGDGSFSGIELTPAQQAAMDRVVSDTGRNLAPFTGVIFAPLYVCLSFGVVKLLHMVRRVVQSYSPRRT